MDMAWRNSISNLEEYDEVATAPVMVPPKLVAKKGKRGSDETPDLCTSSKKEETDIEQVDLTKEKAKKLKKVLIESQGQKKNETNVSNFEEEVADAPIKVLPAKAAKKGKRGLDEALDKCATSKKEKIEVEHVVLSKKKVKKQKMALFEPLGQKKEETKSSDFEEEVAAPIMVRPIKAAKKGKRGYEDLPEKQGNCKKQKIEGDKVGQNNKKVKKLKNALIEPTGKKIDELSSSDFEEEDTNNRRTCSLSDDTENKKTLKTFENEPKAPANMDEKSGTKRLFVGNLSSEITRDDLLEFFKKAGEIIEVRLAATEDGSFRGFGHVEFASAADAQRALGMKYELLLGQRVMIDLAKEIGSNDPPPKGKGVQNSAHYVYVKGFAKSLEEEQIRNLLKEHFRSCGEIIGVSIPQDRKTGHAKGFAFVLFNDQDTVSKALQLNGTELGSYTLTVKQPAPHNSGTFDGAYRGGRGGRGRSANQGRSRGENFRGRGRGRGGPGAL